MIATPSRFAPLLVALAVVASLATAPPAAAAPAASLAEARQIARELLVDLAQGRITVEEARSRAGEPLALEAAGTGTTDKGSAARIVGTWLVHVPGEAPFDALQSFDISETFVETSSLLGSLVEGPAHGAWRPDGGQVVLTFELFAFEDGAAVGRIRVRARIVPRKNRFDAQSAVDVILPDGEVIPEVATGPFSGVRIVPQAP